MTTLKNLVGAGLPSLAAQAINGVSGPGLVATGSTQADAYFISADVSTFATVASGAGAVLPTAGIGDSYLVVNSGANALKVYPPLGGQIGALAVNAPFAVLSGASAAFKATNAAGTDYAQAASSAGVSHVLPKAQVMGLMVDQESPSFTWRDIEGPILANAVGANRPVLATYDGEIEDYAFAADDHYSVIKFHIPHDYVTGTDLFIHTHWSHNGSDISGQLVIEHRFTYSKGHGRGEFHAEKVLTQTISGLNATNTPTKRHRIDEIQFSTAGGTASLVDTSLIEPDGLVILHFNVPTIPTITGGAAKPFIHYVDVHYLSTNIGTKQRAPDFYV